MARSVERVHTAVQSGIVAVEFGFRAPITRHKPRESTDVRTCAAVGAFALSAAMLLGATPALAAPSDQDEAWMVAAHQSNLAEIAAGTAAQENGVSDHVREMGAMLIADHQALDADLSAAAQQFGVQRRTCPRLAQPGEGCLIPRGSGAVHPFVVGCPGCQQAKSFGGR